MVGLDWGHVACSASPTKGPQPLAHCRFFCIMSIRKPSFFIIVQLEREMKLLRLVFVRKECSPAVAHSIISQYCVSCSSIFESHKWILASQYDNNIRLILFGILSRYKRIRFQKVLCRFKYIYIYIYIPTGHLWIDPVPSAIHSGSNCLQGR